MGNPPESRGRGGGGASCGFLRLAGMIMLLTCTRGWGSRGLAPLASPEGPPEEKAHIHWAVVVGRGCGGTPRRTIPDISIHDIPTKPRTEQIKT